MERWLEIQLYTICNNIARQADIGKMYAFIDSMATLGKCNSLKLQNSVNKLFTTPKAAPSNLEICGVADMLKIPPSQTLKSLCISNAAYYRNVDRFKKYYAGSKTFLQPDEHENVKLFLDTYFMLKGLTQWTQI